MLLPIRPKTSTERQRLFRKRHPNHYKELRARQKAKLEAMAAARLAAQQASVTPSQPLLLPAPVIVVEMPAMQLEPARLVSNSDANPR